MKSAVLAGEEGLLTLCGEHLLERNWRITAVLTSSVKVGAWARKAKLRVYSDITMLEDSLDERPDYFFSITNFSIIPDSILSWTRVAAFNFHDGPLPEMAGLNTPSWAILQDAQSHGITWHRLTKDIDGGGIVIKTRFEIDPKDTVLEINAKCFELGFEGFQELIQAIENDRLESAAPDAPRLIFSRAQKPKFLGYIDWSQTAHSIYKLFRATAYAGYRNGLATIKIALNTGFVTPIEVRVLNAQGCEATPGTILEKDDSKWVIQTGSGTLGVTLPTSQQTQMSTAVGELLPDIAKLFPSDFEETELGHLHDDMCWVPKILGRELQNLQHIPIQEGVAPNRIVELPLTSSRLGCEAQALAAVATLLGRMNSSDTVAVAVANPRLRTLADKLPGFILPYCPVFLDIESTGNELLEGCESELQRLHDCPPLTRELFSRIPALEPQLKSYSEPEFVFSSVADAENDGVGLAIGRSVTLVFSQSNNSIYLLGDDDSASIGLIDRLLSASLDLVAEQGELASLPLLNPGDEELLQSVNASTNFEYQETTLDELVASKARSDPDAVALCWKGEACTYRKLLDKAAVVSSYLERQNLARNALVGVMLENKIEAVYTMLGILQSGLAYVPLDPSYPSDRLVYIANDAGLTCIFADPQTARLHRLQDVSISPAQLSEHDEKTLVSEHHAQDRAYVIYTSGSTGKPKGVQVSHDNVVNFMLGMDKVIGSHSGTMLSVTSISFDISVLEIWWSLSRGLKVVFYDEDNTTGEGVSAEVESAIQFSLYFWNTQDPAAPSTVDETYNLLKEAVTFADENGFEAVWSPERHFGSFGGPFPNPAITSAALAMVTEHVKIRAGSCVLPLHNPIRVAEDWAMIDNLSHGRVGISFASGWMPQDFVIAPQNFAQAKDIMFEGIQQVRALWRGESVEFEGPQKKAAISTLPRPVQAELPSWITAAGSPDTFAQAGKLGLNILTHLLGQSVAELEQKIKIYRRAWEDEGHPGSGCVTLMLHTFVSTSKDDAREICRSPMKAYLKSAMNLVKAAAWDFPTFKQMGEQSKEDMDEYFAQLTDEDMDDLLEFAFQRYFEEAGLFGSPEENLALVEKLQAIGVNEIGCLIDFGLSAAHVLENLPYLNELKSRSTHLTSNNLNKIIDHYSITHMQCTPSQANMFTLDNADFAGMKKLDYLLVGGEALSQNLADKLSSSVGGEVINMYGPTETTVWSLTKTVESDHPVQIGLPIANTSVHVLDHRHREVPVGWLGELYIGGRGVSLGYLNRPELNEEKFIQLKGEQLYATGDTVRMSADGNLEFIGRNDDQVKIRGYRIELGEIESALEKVSGIDEAVVIGEPDQFGELQLVAYFTSRTSLEVQQIRTQLNHFLPPFMVPSKLVSRPSIPRTLNGKVDRKALRLTDSAPPNPAEKSIVRSTQLPPAGSTAAQSELLEIWQGLLDVDEIDVNANFFDIGGHSILAVRLQGILSKKYGRRVPISELFRYPTIASLSGYLNSAGDEGALEQSELVKDAASRAARRRSRFSRP